jgi:hypothetical protein
MMGLNHRLSRHSVCRTARLLASQSMVVAPHVAEFVLYQFVKHGHYDHMLKNPFTPILPRAPAMAANSFRIT